MELHVQRMPNTEPVFSEAGAGQGDLNFTLLELFIPGPHLLLGELASASLCFPYAKYYAILYCYFLSFLVPNHLGILTSFPPSLLLPPIDFLSTLIPASCLPIHPTFKMTVFNFKFVPYYHSNFP